ncbi:energy-coupled thiamine transporter ThiT [Planomicrobium okeanokoites]|uniref:energy-coupled thiamine transporter ThiT n=1 Tax=Planomicrobium okeanokoites TaxID=244 RepID=UPI0009FBED39|nr:energy-coupled thiamine transporter ThiT [Planomicrobium okeanokoites]
MRNKKLLLMLEIAIFGALGFVLDFIAFSMPQGGSVSLVMIPIILMAFRRGMGAGILTGLTVGLLQLVTGRVYIVPLSFGFAFTQVTLDYLVAFASVGVAGIMRSAYLKNLRNGSRGKAVSSIVAGALIGAFLRYIIHVIVGIWFFSEFATGNVYIYSFVYNATYMVPAFLLTAFVCSILFIAAPRLIDVKE